MCHGGLHLPQDDGVSPSVPSRPGADGADRIDVIAIAGKDGTAASQGQARQQIAKEFKNFNAAKAQCFKVEDRERLLAVIEAGLETSRSSTSS